MHLSAYGGRECAMIDYVGYVVGRRMYRNDYFYYYGPIAFLGAGEGHTYSETYVLIEPEIVL